MSSIGHEGYHLLQHVRLAAEGIKEKQSIIPFVGIYLGDVTRASESKKLWGKWVGNKVKRNQHDSQSSHLFRSHLLDFHEFSDGGVHPELYHIVRTGMQDHPRILWIRPVQVYAIAAVAAAGIANQTIKGILPGRA